MKEDESIESRIQQAMRSRVQHFRDQADSLTFEGVRRVLEKDLVLDKYALDVHKRFVKQLLEKFLSETEDDEKVSEKIKLEDVKEEQPKEQKVAKIQSENEEIVDDSPVMGLLSKTETETETETEGNAEDKIPTEDMIKEAIWKKAAYFKSKSEELTVAGVRRLIEEDLELKKFSLDSFKKFISKQLDEVLNSENDDIEVEVKPKKKVAQKGKVQKSEEPKKRKTPAQEIERPKKKKTKRAEETSIEKNDDDSSAEKSESSAEKSTKKEVVAPVYGKKVERLKSIIKACGMTVAPSVYRKAKQAPENKREAFLIKELEEVLSKEGLSSNPSEKEIKEVKRKKEKAKELEGIDTSNIVVGSRSRRSTFNFVAPPKPKEPIIDSEDDSEEEDSDNDSEDDSGESDKEDDDDQDKEDVDDQDQEDNGDANKTEEILEETNDSE